VKTTACQTLMLFHTVMYLFWHKRSQGVQWVHLHPMVEKIFFQA